MEIKDFEYEKALLRKKELAMRIEENKKLTEKKKSELVVLTNNLKDQTKIVAETVKEKNSILTETKNTESNYKKIPGISGATILGDGGVALILDVAALLRAPR